MSNNLNTSGLRICIASTGLGHVTRGVEAWADDLARCLYQRGEQVILCKGGGIPEREYERVVRCWTRGSKRTARLLRLLPNRIGWRFGLGNGYSIEQMSFAWKLLGILRAERMDVLHVQDPLLAILCQRARHLGFISTRVVFGHVTEEPHELLQQIEFLHHVAPWHEQQFTFRDHRSYVGTVIPNFIDTETFKATRPAGQRREWAIPDDAIVVLVASAIKRKHKRIDYLIKEFEIVQQRHPDVPIYWFFSGGRDADTAELVAMATRLLGDRVRFAIQHPRLKMPDLFRISDLFVQGSLFEMFGVVLLEAMASAVPCIAHHHPVMSWIIGDGGVTCDLSQSGVLANTLEDLIRDPVRRAKMSCHARERCERVFDQEIVVDRFLEFYEQVLTANKTAA